MNERWNKRFGIASRLLLALLIVSLFHLLFFSIAIQKEHQADEVLHRVVHSSTSRLSILRQMRLAIQEVRNLNLLHVITPSAERMSEIAKERHTLTERFNAWQSAYARLSSLDEAERRLFEEFSAFAAEFISKSNTTIDLSTQNKKEAATRWVNEVVTPIYYQTHRQGQELDQHLNLLIQQETVMADRLRYDVLWAFIVLGPLEMLFIGLIIIMGKRHISQPIEQLTAKIGEIVTHRRLGETVEPEGPREVYQLADSFNEMIIALRQRFKEFNGLLDCSRLASASLDPHDVMQTILENAYPLVGCAEGIGFILDRNERLLNISVWPGRVLGSEEETSLFMGRGCVWKAALTSKTAVLNADSNECIYCSHICGQWARQKGYGSIIATPLVGRENVVGVLMFMMRENEVPEETIKLSEALANQGALVVENARLFDNLKESYLSTVIALAAAVEARDPYTRNHCERVADYAEALARRLNLPDDEIEKIRQASLLHDIGKIGIPDRILLKGGALSEAEYDVIKTHPVISASIIADIPFLEDIVPLIRHHHERFDGKGYPSGLKGEQIPLGARIIAIADAFDAMTENRPYRSALSRREALEELLKAQNEQFDGSLTKAFIDMMIAKENTLQAQKNLGILPAESKAHG